MAIRAILCDLDGVILDSCGEKGKWLFFRAAKELGLPAGKRERQIADSLWGACSSEVIAACWPKADYHTFVTLWGSMELASPPPLVSGVREALMALHAAGFTLGIFTNRGDISPYAMLSVHKVRNFFSIFYTRAMLPEGGKGNPESVTIVLQDLAQRGFAKEEVLFVGDSRGDLVWAEMAGVPFLGVCTGVMTRKEFFSAGHARVVQSIALVPEFLRSLGKKEVGW